MTPPAAEDNGRGPDGIREEFCRTVLETAPLAMIAADAELKILTCNAAASEILKLTGEEVVGRPLWEIAPPHRRRLLEKLLHRVLHGRESAQFEIASPQNPDRALMVLLAAIPAGDGHGGGVTAWVVDETEPRRLASELAKAEKMASLGTLAAGVAHHFNNILGGVATFVDYALTSGDPNAAKRALQMTAEAASRASEITQSLLSFAAKDSQNFDLADLTEIVLTFVHLVEKALAEKHITVDLDITPVPIIPLEANRMHQVLGNLLSNAEDALPQGGQVIIRLRPADEEHVELVFEDNGEGIAKQDLAMIFEPFFTTKGLLAGGDKANPGLGLSVVHGLIEEMGGTIAAESQIGSYTRMRIVLPIPPEEDEDEDVS
jgi:two-component system cell cycle sensor histidine kinase/response regulator CckA